MKLITEHTEELEYITEDVDGSRKYMIEGVFAQAEKQNRNGRVYPRGCSRPRPTSTTTNRSQRVVRSANSVIRILRH